MSFMSTRTGLFPLSSSALFLLLAVGAAGCGASGGGESEEPVRVGDPSPPVLIDVERRSTPGDIAVQNLSSQIAGRLALLDRRPDDLAIRGQVVGLLLSRAHYAGSFSDFDRALDVAEGSVVSFPDRFEAYEQRSAALGALHLFAEASADIDRAQALARPGIDLERFAASRVVHALATGAPLNDALVWARDRAAAHPSYGTLSTLASLEAALGEYENADRHYRESLEAYRDVSPFPLAFVSFQRGVMWAEMADEPERAVPLYREAVRRLPSYVVANVHLAELEANLLGETDVAVARLRALAVDGGSAAPEDPEPLGLLGDLLDLQGDARAAGAPIEDARRRYEELLSRHPEAFRDHASEFFAGPGRDPARAVRLSQQNLIERQDPRAFVVAIEAAIAAADDVALCATVVRAEDRHRTSQNLDSLLTLASPRCASGR